ncbi:hypothetical protein L5515_002849 [Caenorhabditis briggsae]|uniref:Uncharacterized protein n=1 Tax=Caenorhabditis briggsae TaxID=6238 RepID=A0AAE9J5C9_CAEBR|nr:hypothetical protein L5515_002849 [Caenorhabditis briggsae]
MFQLVSKESFTFLLLLRNFPKCSPQSKMDAVMVFGSSVSAQWKMEVKSLIPKCLAISMELESFSSMSFLIWKSV